MRKENVKCFLCALCVSAVSFLVSENRRRNDPIEHLGRPHGRNHRQDHQKQKKIDLPEGPASGRGMQEKGDHQHGQQKNALDPKLNLFK
jgi:hypothetical protein